MAKKILGLDLGSNSIGWALVERDFDNKQGKILGIGTRIIPMSQDILGEFNKGNSISQTAERTTFRSVRRLRERHLLRRERLHRILNILGFLPQHYAAQIDFQTRLGKFHVEKEPKIAYDNAKQFIFKTSFEEMLADFKKYQPEILKNENGKDKRIPYDWTIYYLRKKALAQKIAKEELAWVILNFNQKRGYYQLRGEDEDENPNKLIELHSLKIIDVISDDKPNSKGDAWYSLILENGWIYRRSSKTPLFDWKDKTRDFIVTTDINDDGSIKVDKEGKEKRSFRAPGEDDWTLLKKKTEQGIENSHKTVGTFIYDALLQNPKQKLNGKLVRTIERKFYKEELRQILQKQAEFHLELQSQDLYHDCVRELYRNNSAHQLILSKKDFIHLFIEDIIFYQRPLKSKKSLISNCPLEYRKFKTRDENGHEIEKIKYLKSIPKSNPYYQEFRIWTWLQDLTIYKKDDDTNVTKEFLKNRNDYEKLFDFLNNRKEIDQDTLIKYLLSSTGLKGKNLNSELLKYRWNFVENKTYPCNETKSQIVSRLSNVANPPTGFLTREVEHRLWHIVYSVRDKTDFEKALRSFSIKYNLDEQSFIEAFRKFPPFKNEYGSFSEKAIKKLLPLMRIGKYWDEKIIMENNSLYLKNINCLLEKLRKKTNEISKEDNEKWNTSINTRLYDELNGFLDADIESFQGLRLHIAQYLVYGRHSEAKVAGKWNSVDALKEYIKDFKQHQLRNPIVEQVVMETLRLVADIWDFYGSGTKDFLNEIHIELGREMKNTAEERKRLTNKISENENTNLRIKALLTEMQNDDAIENVIPYSPMQQEALKIYEEGVLNSDIEIPEDIAKISKSPQPSKTDLIRYKLWLEQKYRSPYTGNIISLNRLFTTDYEIEHIIPQSRYFDDSLSNKVICESAVNKLKDNQLGLEFIKNHHGEIIETGLGKKVKIFEEEEYIEFAKQQYAKNPIKRNKLLLEDIPEKMVERQLNDTRYITTFISSILSNIVRSEKDDDGINSKNMVPCNGKITTILKHDWGLNDVWNDMILPRFERMNNITNSTDYTAYNSKYQKFLPTVPIELSKNFSKKRIDHRHHAVDALVIACATRDHVNLLNNLYANSKVKRYDLQRKLRNFERVSYIDRLTNQQVERDIPKDFQKPWNCFTVDAKNELGKIAISFKQNLRVINKTTNNSERWVYKNGSLVKELVPQKKGVSWAIRKPLHKETVSGKIEMSRIKVPKGKILTATRKIIDPSFDLKTIESITDTGIQKILKNYLLSKNNNPEIAFSPEGLEDLNKNIVQYNDGKYHQPIYKARVFEIGSKFALGQSGNKNKKYVEAAKGTNLFFALYLDKNGKRNFETIPLNVVIERQKQGLNSVPEKNENGDRLLFHLSPNDLVYVPTEDERENVDNINWKNLTPEQYQNIYKVVSFTGNQVFFVRHEIAVSIVNKREFSPLNKMERSIDGRMIKESCIKLMIDRIGNLSKAKSL